MRIVLLPSAYHPSLGGVEELTSKLAAELVTRGHDVEVWSSRSEGDDWPEREILDGLPVQRFTFPLPRGAVLPALRWPGRAVRELARLRRETARFRPDVLHVQCFGPNGVYATALSCLTGVPLLITLQGETIMDDEDVYDHSLSLSLGLRLGLRRAAAVTACSQFTLDDAVRRFGCPRAKATVIFNGVDVTEASPSVAERPFAVYLLALGRIVHKKGFDLLLRAWADVPEVAGQGLVIAGAGAGRKGLEQVVADLGLQQRVHFAGRLNRQQVAAAMAGARCFVMPSRLEPFGIVLLEAWRAGVGVISTSVGGPPEFVTDGVDGLLIDPEDTSALTEALRLVLDEPSFAEALGSAGQRRVEDFYWRDIAGDYVGTYDRLRVERV